MIVIDSTNLILGRIATFAAKKAILGEDVRVINAEKAVISGKQKMVLGEAKQTRERGVPAKGPFIPRMPDRYVRRVIRGMLPYKTPRGSEAFKRVLCYVGVPEEFKGVDTTTIPGASVDKLPSLNYVSIEKICKTI